MAEFLSCKGTGSLLKIFKACFCLGDFTVPLMLVVLKLFKLNYWVSALLSSKRNSKAKQCRQSQIRSITDPEMKLWCPDSSLFLPGGSGLAYEVGKQSHLGLNTLSAWRWKGRVGWCPLLPQHLLAPLLSTGDDAQQRHIAVWYRQIYWRAKPLCVVHPS